MKKIFNKFLYSLILITILINNFGNLICQAFEITRADIVSIGTADYHLKFFKEESNIYSYIICSIVGHYDNGVFYPAYCMNKDLKGVSEENSYSVNIKELINRDDVWRVVKNGYPYKTFQEMGVANEFDAFVVTKCAIYCITGQSNINDFYAEPDDSEAVAMLNSLKNIVNIGVNGTETRTEGNFSTSKVGDFIEEGDYYYQTYRVDSNIEVKDLDIKITEGLPDGSYISKINDLEFRVYIPKSSLNQNIRGKISISGKSKTYPLFYGESENPETQDYLLTYDTFGNISSQCDVEFITNNGKIKIKKYDSETKKSLEGVEFALYKDGVEIARSTTDKDGVATFNNLFAGDYILKEISTNKNYILDSKEFSVNVKYNETTPIEISNEYKKGQVKVIKVDKDNNKIKLKGVEFKVYDENNQLVDTLITDENGEAVSKRLRIDKTYTIKETKTLQSYVLNDSPVTVTLNADQIETVTFQNELKKGQIKVIKVDKDNNEIKLKGIEFKVYDENNKLVDTLVTDEFGEAVSKRLRIDKNYTIEETKTLQNYILTEEPQTVTLTQDQIKDVKFENEHKKGNLKIYKVDKDNHKIALGNVEFDLFSEEFNKVIGTYTTNVDGEIKIDNLRIGNYKLIEKNTGKWYDLADDTQIKIEWEKTTESMVENELQKGQVKIIKIDKENNEIKLKGVKFNVLDQKGNVLETIVTDENGEAYTSKYSIRDYEKLIIKEIETNKSYKLDETPKTIILKKNEIVTLKIKNELKKGQIKIIKVDKDNKEIKLKNVKFGIYDKNNKLIQTLITNEKGEAISKKLPADEEYYIKELETGKEYELDKKVVKVELKEDEIKNIKFENEKIKNKFKIIKVDKNDKNIKLEGVKFELLDENNNLLETLVTDKNGEAFSKYYPVVNRIYTIHEVDAHTGYLKVDEYTSFKLDKNKIVELTIENEKIPDKPQEEKEEEVIENPVQEEIVEPEEKVIEPEVKVLPRTGY